MATEGEEPTDPTTTTTTKATTTTTTTTTTTKATTTTTAATTTTTTKGSTTTTKKSTTKTTQKTSSTKKTSSTTAATTTTAAQVASGQVAGGSVTFKASNSKRVPVGKSTTLYLTISGISGSYATIFTVDDTSVVSVEKINNQSVKITGIKTGSVVVTASIDGRTAKYTLAIGDAPVTEATTAPTNKGDASEEEPVESIVTDDIELDLFSTPENDQLAEYIEESQQTSAGDILLGIIGFAAIFGGFGVVLSVIFRNRTPKLNLYPGSRRRFNASGASSGKRRKRLLPDHYYRSNDKF